MATLSLCVGWCCCVLIFGKEMVRIEDLGSWIEEPRRGRRARGRGVWLWPRAVRWSDDAWKCRTWAAVRESIVPESVGEALVVGDCKFVLPGRLVVVPAPVCGGPARSS